MVNSCIFIGRLTSAPEQKGSMTFFTIALNRNWIDAKSGEKKEKVTFVKINTFSKLADVCFQYLYKGRQVYVEGELEINQVKGDDDVTRYFTSINAKKVEFFGESSQGENNNDGF